MTDKERGYVAHQPWCGKKEKELRSYVRSFFYIFRFAMASLSVRTCVKQALGLANGPAKLTSGCAVAATRAFSTEETRVYGNLSDQDRIFTNLYGKHDPFLKVRQDKNRTPSFSSLLSTRCFGAGCRCLRHVVCSWTSEA